MSDTVNLQLKILKSGPGKNLVAFAGRNAYDWNRFEKEATLHVTFELFP